jgi:hypothetical protein
MQRGYLIHTVLPTPDQEPKQDNHSRELRSAKVCSVSTIFSDLAPIFEEYERHRCHDQRNCSKHCECPVHSQVLIHWYRDLNHTSSNHISHEGRTHKRTSSMYLECVNQILICRDEDRQYGEANGNRGRKSRPQTDRRESSPSHPEQPNW